MRKVFIAVAFLSRHHAPESGRSGRYRKQPSRNCFGGTGDIGVCNHAFGTSPRYKRGDDLGYIFTNNTGSAAAVAAVRLFALLRS